MIGIFRITSMKIIGQVTAVQSMQFVRGFATRRSNSGRFLTRSSQPAGSLAPSPDSEEDTAP